MPRLPRFEVTLRDVARITGGTVARDREGLITGVASMAGAGASDLTFAADDAHLAALATSRAAAVIAERDQVPAGMGLVLHPHPYLALVRFVDAVGGVWRPAGQGVSDLAKVAPDARIGEDASIGPFAAVGVGVHVGARARVGAGVIVGDGCVLAEDVVLHPRVVLYPDCQVGARTVIHAGAVIGADGFGYLRDGDRMVKIPRIGRVVIEEDVEIGPNTCVDRATFDETVIRRGSKIDNLVQVGHNCQVGPDAVLCAQVGLSGRVTVGRGATMAGQSGVADGGTVGEGATVAGGSGIFSRVGPGEVVGGYPAIPHREFVRGAAALRRLPELRREVADALRRLRQVERALGWSGR
ncbi:MAG: UDP-3-O-(3-hydroxymyristoyl)glucosamine N-acyltransferase [Planctomycetes bacterium]|nr:UDP-3-O-(3-hydroxymyristoyl)glucosamine N-acyltransferase [Planctomycetota bacterium]